MANSGIEALERDMALLVARHSNIYGYEFQRAANNVAAAYYEPGELDPLLTESDLMRLLAERLAPHLARGKK